MIKGKLICAKGKFPFNIFYTLCSEYLEKGRNKVVMSNFKRTLAGLLALTFLATSVNVSPVFASEVEDTTEINETEVSETPEVTETPDVTEDVESTASPEVSEDSTTQEGKGEDTKVETPVDESVTTETKESTEKPEETSKKEDVIGNVYVKVDEGAVLTVTCKDKAYEISMEDEKVIAKDLATNVATDVTSSLVKGYYLVASELVDSNVTVNIKSLSNYNIATYHLKSNQDDSDDVDIDKSEYYTSFKIEEGDTYFTVTSKKEEEVKEETKEGAAEEDATSEDSEDWLEIAKNDPTWAVAGDEYVTPEVQEEVKGYVSETNNSGISTYGIMRAARSSIGTITEYHPVVDGASKVGHFEINYETAFCTDHDAITPARDTNVVSVGELKNDNARKVLFYGMYGPETMVGTTDYDWIMTSKALSYAMGNSSAGSETSWYYDELTDNDVPPASFQVTLWAPVDSSGNIISSEQVLATWEYQPAGRLSLTKSTASAYTDLVAGNAMYSLKGAVYGVYSNAGCTARVGTLTTNAKGKSNVIELDEGTYYVKELTAPMGYKKDEDTYVAYVTYGSTYVVYCEDGIKGDPAGISLSKQSDSKTSDAVGNTKLAGAEYTIKYYDNYGCSGSPKRTWVYKTDTDGMFFMYLSSYLMSGSLYKDSSGNPIFLYGSYSVQETKAPVGYNLDTYIYKASVNDSTGASWKWTDTSLSYLKTYNSVTKETAAKEVPYRGSVQIQKLDAETSKTTPQGDADFSNIQFSIINKSKNVVSYGNNLINPGDVVTTITTNSNGIAKTPDKSLEYGDYAIYETKSNSKYRLSDSTKRDFSITSDGQVVKLGAVVKNTPIKGGIKITKQDAQIKSGKTVQGDASLEGIKFDIINKSTNPVVVGGKTYAVGETVKEITTKYVGNEAVATTGSGDLPYGTYQVKEVATNDSYRMTDGTVFSVQIREDKKIVSVDTSGKTLTFNNQVVRGGVKLQKNDEDLARNYSQGDATLAGAIYEIYNDSKTSVIVDGHTYAPGSVCKTITTNDTGYAATATDSLPYGTYHIVEKSPSRGYLLDTSFNQSFTIRTDGEMIDLTPSSKSSYEPVVRGGLKITKQDYELHKNSYTSKLAQAVLGKTAQGDATLEGITFKVKNKSTHSVVVDKVTYATGDAVATITTKYEGNEAVAKLDADTLPYGTYTVEEVKSNGTYHLTDGTVYTFQIRNDGQIVSADIHGSTMTFNNKVIRGGVKLQKQDEDLRRIYSQGDATLKGAVYSIYNDSKQPVLVDNVLYNPGDLVKRITTDDNGYAATATDSLPYGTYHIVEETPSTGYLLDEDYYQQFSIRSEGQMIDLTTADKSSYEPVIRGGVQIQKWDLELDKSEALGGKDHGNNTTGTHLEGIQFEITNRSNHNVYVEGKEYNVGDIVKTITTHWNEDLHAYTAETSADCLPYGTYSIKETKTTKSYLLTDTTEYTFKIRENGKIVTADTKGTQMIYKNQVVRGDVKWVKIADSTSKRLAVPFIITNVSTGEQHVVCTDVNGEFNTNSSWNKHNTDTNANDWMLDVMKTDPTHVFSADDMVDTAGVWFANGEEGSQAKVNNSLGALPYGDYILTEMRCENNTAYSLQQIAFKVYKDSTTVNMGTITDDETSTSVDISTIARDFKSNSHMMNNDEDAKIIDTVHMVGLIPGERYKLRARLMSYEDEDTAIKVNGRKVKVEKEFTADNPIMDVEVEIPFDASKLGSTTMVVYETLYRNGDKQVAEEVDVENEDQRMYIPKITTKAVDSVTGTNFGTAVNPVIKDTVSYSNIQPGLEYKVKGSLVNKETGDVVAEGETVFTPTEITGDVEVTFDSFTAPIDGSTLVAFEKLTVNDTVIAEHKDLEDEDQTIWFADVKTTATDTSSNSHVGTEGTSVTVKDEVKCSNLVKGKEYSIRGILVDKATGNPIEPKGKQVTAEKTFTADDSEVTVTLEFTFDSSELRGTTVVAFEDLYQEGIQIATHNDLTDEDQSIHYAEIGTTAVDTNTNDNVGTTGKTTIKDTVAYKNLIVGQEYTVVGTLMDKATGKEFGSSPIKATTTFTAESTEGTVDLIYSVDSSELDEKTLVVFEDLMVNGIVVISHSDIDDEGQTIHFPKIVTQAKTNEGLQETLVGNTVTVTDVVSYTNLVVGKEYTVKGKLMNKETGEELLVNGAPITQEVTFIPDNSRGSVNLDFIVDTSALEGNTIVVFEDLYHNAIKVATHSSLTDTAQSIRVPKLTTTALDGKTSDHEGLAENEMTFVDTLSYTNLEVNAKYSIVGKLVDKDTGELIKDGTYSGTFTPGSENGSTAVTFNFDGEALKGKTIVALEEIYRDEKLIAKHSDVTDTNQMVSYPKIETQAVGKESGLSELDASKVTVVDTVSYSNLVKGTEYALNATLIDKETGKELKINDKVVTAIKKFTPDKADGSVDVEIPVDAMELQGKTLVVYESLEKNGKVVGEHKDITDTKQTVYIPSVSTEAIDKSTGFNEGIVSPETTIVDTVSYSNLAKGTEYTLKGTLIDKETGKEFLVNNNKVESSVTFTTEESEERVSGTQTLEFSFDSSELGGKDIVVYEYLYQGDKLVGHHTDLEDDKQTVSFPSVSTVATFTTTGTHEQQAGEKTIVKDIVSYKNLKVGQGYVVKGILMDKTGNAIKVNDKQITSNVEFIPEKSEGSVDVEYKFDSTSFEGKDIVVFETIYRDDKVVASHEDLEDDKQTVSIIDISTVAVDRSTGKKEMTLGDSVELKDTVSYKNLTEGNKYSLKGFVVDKAKKEVIAESSAEFKADKADGSTDVIFKVNTNKVTGKELVVYEELYDGDGNLIASHKDIDDKDQTVSVPTPPTTPPTTPPVTPPETPQPPMVKTGDIIAWASLAGVILVFIGGFAIVNSLRKKKKDKVEK